MPQIDQLHDDKLIKDTQKYDFTRLKKNIWAGSIIDLLLLLESTVPYIELHSIPYRNSH